MNSAIIGKKRRDALVAASQFPLIDFETILKGTNSPPLVPTPAPTLMSAIKANLIGLKVFTKIICSSKYKLIKQMNEFEKEEFIIKSVNLSVLRQMKEEEQEVSKSDKISNETQSTVLPSVVSTSISFPKQQNERVPRIHHFDSTKLVAPITPSAPFPPVARVMQIKNENPLENDTAPMPKVPRPFLK